MDYLSNRADVSLSPGQIAAIRRAENGRALSEHQKGVLMAAWTHANRDDAVRARWALDEDEKRRKGRR